MSVLVVNIIRPHHSSMYVDMAYRPSTVVCRSVCHSSELCAKTAQQIEMSFRLKTRVGPRNRVLDRGPDPLMEGAILRGKGQPYYYY